ncbi:MAG TPA: pectate lyase, partial [Verrucomicrobiae bacterium]
DQTFFQRELQAHGLTQPILPRATHDAKGLDLSAAAEWYAGATARHIAEVVVSYQTPAGGWSKNTDYTQHLRAPGELYGVENVSHNTNLADFDHPENLAWNYVGTIDNAATTTELEFLARVISADKKDAQFTPAFLRGLEYLFAAQYPNGGWPQVWPLQGGYHDAVTLNDNAMLHVLQFLRAVATDSTRYAFVPAEVRTRADKAWKQGLDCLLTAQVIVQGKPMVWCQQYDALTLAPASARNFEMPALASTESATLMGWLMTLPEPDARVVRSVHAAAAWLEQTKLMDKKFTGTGLGGKLLIDAPGNGPIWARFYEIGTNRPLFGDRDRTIHDNVNDISRERRKGYGWYGDTAKRMLEHYRKWTRLHPPLPE